MLTSLDSRVSAAVPAGRGEKEVSLSSVDCRLTGGCMLTSLDSRVRVAVLLRGRDE